MQTHQTIHNRNKNTKKGDCLKEIARQATMYDLKKCIFISCEKKQKTMLFVNKAA
jgi:hypothetical protein